MLRSVGGRWEGQKGGMVSDCFFLVHPFSPGHVWEFLMKEWNGGRR